MRSKNPFCAVDFVNLNNINNFKINKMTKKVYPFIADAKREAAGTKKEVYKLEDGNYYVGSYDGALKENAKRGKFRKLKK